MSKKLAIKYLQHLKEVYEKNKHEAEDITVVEEAIIEIDNATAWAYAKFSPIEDPEVMKGIFQILKDWLLQNGFEIVDKNSYANEFCNVVVNEEGMEVCDNYGMASYIEGHRIAYLMGELAYRELFPKGRRFAI